MEEPVTLPFSSPHTTNGGTMPKGISGTSRDRTGTVWHGSGRNDPSRPLVFDEQFSTGDKAITVFPFTGIRYNPRTAQGSGLVQWLEDVAECARKSGIPSSIYLQGPPTIEGLKARYPNYDLETLEQRLEGELAVYAPYNTRFWDVVRPGLVVVD